MSYIDEYMQKQLQQIEHLDKVLKTIEGLYQKQLQPLEEEEGEEEEEEERAVNVTVERGQNERKTD